MNIASFLTRIRAATSSETVLLNRAYYQAQDEMRKSERKWTKDELAAKLRTLAEKDPYFPNVFGTTFAASKNLFRAVDEFLKKKLLFKA